MAGKTKLMLTGLWCLAVLAGCGGGDVTSPPNAVDTAPPAVPVDIQGEIIEAQVIVHWAPNTTDADLVGYMVYRANGTRVATMCPAPIDQTWYVDENPMVGENVYRVSAVDANDNQSAMATVTVTVDDSPTQGYDLASLDY
ncbi:MAG: hypothetical protein C0395_03645 [Gemmatimonas sp.]|nr:hypothetical protein [Gemmatimonas sp.]